MPSFSLRFSSFPTGLRQRIATASRREMADRARKLNGKFCEHLESRRWLSLHRFDDMTELMKETRSLYKAWDTLDDVLLNDVEIRSRTNRTVEFWRRNKLAQLRLMIGEDAYNLGRMPPPVPLWAFVEIDR